MTEQNQQNLTGQGSVSGEPVLSEFKKNPIAEVLESTHEKIDAQVPLDLRMNRVIKEITNNTWIGVFAIFHMKSSFDKNDAQRWSKITQEASLIRKQISDTKAIEEAAANDPDFENRKRA